MVALGDSERARVITRGRNSGSVGNTAYYRRITPPQIPPNSENWPPDARTAHSGRNAPSPPPRPLRQPGAETGWTKRQPHSRVADATLQAHYGVRSGSQAPKPDGPSGSPTAECRTQRTRPSTAPAPAV